MEAEQSRRASKPDLTNTRRPRPLRCPKQRNGPSADTPSFESQLSAALAESLEKLGVNGGEVNISIRNPSSSTRQIVVTYSTDGSSVASSTAFPNFSLDHDESRGHINDATDGGNTISGEVGSNSDIQPVYDIGPLRRADCRS